MKHRQRRRGTNDWCLSQGCGYPQSQFITEGLAQYNTLD